MIDQFRARLEDIKTVVDYSTQLGALKWAMTEHKKAIEKAEADSVAALDKWHEDESTDPKPVVYDGTADKAKIDTAGATIDSIAASMKQTVSQLDKAMKELT